MITIAKTDSTMIDQSIREYLLPEQFNAAVRAGAAIMKIYKNSDDYDISLKSDRTPITVADRHAHLTIKESLGRTRIPILSEEGREMLYEERKNWDMFWLVDPLDGTIEFIKRNNEFTVNIALMANNICVAAVVYVPYLQKIYVAEQGAGAYLLTGVAPDSEAAWSDAEIEARRQSLPLPIEPRPFRVAVSRSHRTANTANYIEQMRHEHANLEVVEQGSSYKLCLMAEGVIDYTEGFETYEWDTAAAELVLSEAGGVVRSLPEYQRLLYNKEDLHNPWFVCHRFR